MKLLFIVALIACVVYLSETKKKMPVVPILIGVTVLFWVTSNTVEGATDDDTDCSGFPGNFFNWFMCLFKSKDSADKTGYGTCPCFKSCSDGTKQSPSPQKCSKGKTVKADGLCAGSDCVKDDFKDGSGSNCCVDGTGGGGTKAKCSTITCANGTVKDPANTNKDCAGTTCTTKDQATCCAVKCNKTKATSCSTCTKKSCATYFTQSDGLNYNCEWKPANAKTKAKAKAVKSTTPCIVVKPASK